ncbi:glycine-rich domain-containing protein [Paraburkholderia antibiotica]|uniref:Uncharacterized protein n=1 Tax=Paraburkholderia antibiotica TaxID=2728839 RepID=A0A7X9X8Q5_9BURK|nr:hypothetical protein [Paraburkholderia antibiotica]NML33571.1 hypothetical protein [Paraburkholderia antibiotica]
MNRWDETWHRLREWTNGQAPSERLSAQILTEEGFRDIDPSHPLGGKDGGRDACCEFNGEPWVMAVFFPRGEKSFAEIAAKFASDVEKIKRGDAKGIAFVTNQELRLSERSQLEREAQPLKLSLFHLERITTILDRPNMAAVRKQFLSIDDDAPSATHINFGGGGMAPGAGGGGGGAIGDAHGGTGGLGGNTYNFSGSPGTAPGAGGGGAGAFGPGSKGGEGGGGGEYKVFKMDVTPGMTIPIKIGEGGKAGEDGGDTSFGDVVAKGGEAGKAGHSVIVTREVTEDDRDAGLHISALIGAACCYFRDGLAYILSAGIDQFSFGALPGKISIVMYGTLSIGDAPQGVEYELTASLVSPEGASTCSQPLRVFSGLPRPVVTAHFNFLMEYDVSQAGIWTIEVHSAGHRLAKYPIEVKVAAGLLRT